MVETCWSTITSSIRPEPDDAHPGPEEWAEIVRPYANAGEDRRPTLDWPRSVPFGDDDTTLRRKLERQADWLATTPIPKLHIAGLPGAIAVIGGRRRAARGGTATVSEVTADLLASYPDISETSIRTNLSTLRFITKGGVVWRRTKADGWPPVPPLRAVRGAFHNGMNVIRVAIPVTSELLRGSGQALHPAVAAAAATHAGVDNIRYP